MSLHSKRFPETTEPHRRICFIQQSYPPRKKKKKSRTLAKIHVSFLNVLLLPPQNHEMALVGGDLKDHLVQSSCHGQDCQPVDHTGSSLSACHQDTVCLVLGEDLASLSLLFSR